MIPDREVPKMDAQTHYRLSALSARIVVSFVRHNPVEASALPAFVEAVRRVLAEVTEPGMPRRERRRPAPPIPIGRSVTADYIVSFETGGHFKSLKRHLTALGLTPAAYRKRWNLPHDYPMVAASFSARRSLIAKRQGFGIRQRN